MTELDSLIEAAFKSQGELKLVNKFYAAFLRSHFYLPVQALDEKTQAEIEAMGESFIPFFVRVEDKPFMLIFDELPRLKAWAKEIEEPLAFVSLTGREIVTGLADTVFLALNYLTPYYKEFAPDEVARLKTVVAKTSSR